ncbi:MAG: EutN/CcmL family microcompartment protein [Elusimicrobiales bacterium]|jgi:microcompartment protein CcmK/EutM
MLFARVVGTVVCTCKDERLVGSKLLMVQPVGLDDKPRGNVLVGIDSVGAGPGELVLLVQGSSARQTSGTENSPVDCTIFAIVDTIEKDGATVFRKRDDAGGK